MNKLVLIAAAFLLKSFSPLNAQVTIAAAANLKDVMTEIVTDYNHENPNARVEVIFGSSGKLFQQIVNGAPFDLFFSADNNYPEKIKEQGYTIGEVKPYATGQLVLWSATVNVEAGIDILTSNTIRHIAIANARLAPYGDRAMAVLNYYRILDKVKDKLVIGENISQTAQYVSSGNTDAGFIALSQALSPELKKKGHYLIIDPKTYNPLIQSFVMLKHAAGNHQAAKFAAYILSDKAGKYFVKYGYKLPRP